MESSRSPLNGVPSMNRPSRDPTFPPICSRTWATVIRDGIACGLMIRSGMIPWAVKGISSCGAMSPMTPFCPCLEANLSPSSGTRRSRTLTLASFEPFSLSVSMTESTQPYSPCRTVTEVSRRFCGVRKSVSSSRNRGGLGFPMRTSPPFTNTCGEMSPSSVVRFAYEGSAQAQGLLRHARAHRDPRGRVVLRIRHDAGGDSQDHHRVDLDMRVVLRDHRFHAERFVTVDALEFRVVVPAPHVHPGDVVPAEGMFALLAAARDVVGIEGDEGVLFLLRVDPFHDPVPDEVGEPEAAHLELVDVFSGEDDVAILDDQQRPPDAALVAVDDDLAHVLVQADVDLVAEEPRPPPLADLADEELRVLVEADEVSVDVDPRELGLLPLHLFRPEVREKQFDLLLREAFGNVDHEGAILDEAAILPFGRLVGAEPAPLRRMEVSSLKVGLRTGQGRRDSPQVAQRAHVGRAVEELAHARPPADPVARREGVEEPLGEQVRTDRRGNLQLSAARIGPFELILEILDQVGKCDPEQVLHAIAV